MIHHSQDQKSHYEVLGLQSGATVAEIRAAYLKVAKGSHPDRSPEGGLMNKKQINLFKRLLPTRFYRILKSESNMTLGLAWINVMSWQDQELQESQCKVESSFEALDRGEISYKEICRGLESAYSLENTSWYEHSILAKVRGLEYDDLLKIVQYFSITRQEEPERLLAGSTFVEAVDEISEMEGKDY